MTGIITKEDIARVLSFLPYFAGKPVAARLGGGKQIGPDEFQMPYACYSDEVHQFIDALYRSNFVEEFNWPEWQPRAMAYVEDSQSVSRAPMEDIVRLFTTHVRKDKVCEGHFAAMIDSGHILHLLNRLVEVQAQEHEPVDQEKQGSQAKTVSWQYFPKSSAPPEIVLGVVGVFNRTVGSFDSQAFQLQSNEVLAILVPGLQSIGFKVETGKNFADKIQVPVLFGRDGKIEKSFFADAYSESSRFVLEVEAGRGVENNQFLKDLFQACMMHDVEYFAVAVRRKYRTSNHFETVITFIETLYASSRLSLPLKGILVLGY